MKSHSGVRVRGLKCRRESGARRTPVGRTDCSLSCCSRWHHPRSLHLSRCKVKSSHGMHLSPAPGPWRHLSKQMHEGGGGGQEIGGNVPQLKEVPQSTAAM